MANSSFTPTVYTVAAPVITPVSGVYNAVKNDILITDSSSGSFTITLPASPAIGDQIEILDGAKSWGTNNVTVGRNGLNIDGAASNLTLNVVGGKVRLIYFSISQGWRTF